MSDFIKGLALCEGFFNECAKPIIDKYFPDLHYSAGLIGYGSDVLGYDDEVSRDHMWGPRFYMFLSENDIDKKDEILNRFAENLPYEYMVTVSILPSLTQMIAAFSTRSLLNVVRLIR